MSRLKNGRLTAHFAKMTNDVPAWVVRNAKRAWSAFSSMKQLQRSRPNDRAEWEREYLTAVRPVERINHPIARVLEELTAPGELLLEAGCGSGELSAELAHAGRQIVLADFSERILRRAVEVFRVSKLSEPEIIVCDLTQQPLPCSDNAVDWVWSSGVLEHWTDEEIVPIVREMARISRKGVISLVPYASSVLYRLGKWHAEQAGKWPYGREIPRCSLRHVFETAGLKNVREFPVWDSQAVEFLGMIDERLWRIARQWWSTLESDDPVRQGQGYLLLTCGTTE